MRSLLVLSMVIVVRTSITGNGIEEYDYSLNESSPSFVQSLNDERPSEWERREEQPVVDRVEEISKPSLEQAAAPPSLFPTPSPLVVFPKVDKANSRIQKESSIRSIADIFNGGDARPSFVRRRIEEWAVESGRTEFISRVLLDLDTRESRTRSTLVLLRTAFRDLEQLIDLAPDARKEKKRIEDIGYAFYPLLSQALQAIDELDALLFFSDLTPKELKKRLAVWSERRASKMEKHLNNVKEGKVKGGPVDARYTLLLEKILATVLMDSQRDLAELDSVRVGRPMDFAF
ncbi:hypothetical protein PRIPAC_76566 [Pristionchus pacificus]|uniref:Uncharacterized protein n=1 Tax=Pristionchus pacificus TaxID=54126 RepID=A0A2A6CR89_PRIPA|nr:hypothetical protein PRIPAC_76566 [Pristionchus pacificus]|eukprot:PDM80563.1 hypothetical protein PRIPAC_35566 [Pristionchus pacificus]